VNYYKGIGLNPVPFLLFKTAKKRMLQQSTLKFLTNLKKNNNKNWFEAHRDLYEEAKQDFAFMVDDIIKAIAGFDEPIGLLKPKECTFRINRDVRFSADKRPYKSNMAAAFSRGGKKAIIAGYYFHCEPGQNFVAGGFYNPMPQELAKIRQEIDYGFDEWQKIIGAKKFRTHFSEGVQGTGTLVRPPKGYEEDNPAISFLKMKGFIVKQQFTDTDLLDKDAVKKIAAAFEAMKPMIDFLNRAVE
jgi:uncharacterized protein (TIGR02453 family)